MSSRKRSASVGAAPFNKPIARTPAESSVVTQPEVRCACQYFQCDSLLPERINPVGSRPTSRAGDRLSTSRDKGLDRHHHPHSYQSSSVTEQQQQQHLDVGQHMETCPVHANTLPNVVQKPVFTAGNRTQLNTLPKSSRQSTFGSQRSMDQLRMSQSSLLKRYRPQSDQVSVAQSTMADENPHFEHYTMSRSSSRARSIHGSRRSIDRFSMRPKFERTASDQTDHELEDLDWDMDQEEHAAKQEELKRAAEEVTRAITEITQEKPAPKPLTLSLSGDGNTTGNRRVISGSSMPVTSTVQVTLPPSVVPVDNKENPMSITIDPPVPKVVADPVVAKKDFFPTMTPANQMRKTNVPDVPVVVAPPEKTVIQSTNVNPTKPSQTHDMPHITEGMRDAIFAAQILTPKGDKVQEEFKLTAASDRMDHYHTLPTKKRAVSTRAPSVDAGVRKGGSSQQISTDRMRTSQPNLQAFSRPPLPKQRSEEERPPPPMTISKTTDDSSLDNRSRPAIRNNRHVERSKSSSLLQKYGPKKAEHAYDRPQSEVRDFPSKMNDIDIEEIFMQRRESSTTFVKAEPLDEKKIKQSSLLRKYCKDPGGSKDSGDGAVTMDVANRFSPVMFGGKKRNIRQGDHEYEPIGQPASSKQDPPSPDVQMSAQEFQLQMEDRFFNQAPVAQHNPEVVITAPSFDETTKAGSSTEPEKRKKSFMASAQEQGRLFQRKLSSQADNLKTKISNMKKPKTPEAETVEEHKEEVVVETVETTETTEEASAPKKRFQKPDFTKLKGHLPEFKRPEMPKMKKPNFDKIKAMKRPSFDRPRMPEIPKMDFNKHFQNMKKLGRSKSVKEEGTSEEKPESEAAQIEITEIDEVITTTNTVPTKKKRFDVDFRTYPRMITNKFKKTKKPTPVASVKNLTPVLKPRQKGSKQELDTESGQFTEYNKDIDLDRETSVERRMRVHLEKAIEEYRQIEEEETKHQASQLTKQDSFPRKKKGKKAIPQPDSFDSREFDFNQNEMDSEGASKASTQELQDIIKRSQVRPFGRTDTQSLQSGDRRGVLEEIDDDHFFLRKKGISEDNIQMGEYISSAIREGLMDPVNVLAQMGQYDDYQLDEEEMRYLEELQKQGSDFQLELDANLMPSKPGRKQKKQSSEEISDEQAQKWMPIKDIDEDSVEISHRDFSRFVPPTPPKRRKKRNAPMPKGATKNMNGYEELPGEPSHQQEVTVYRQEQTFAIPLAKAESGDGFVPVPIARRSRSRSTSLFKDENRSANIIEEDKLSLEVPGYAVIKKDPPPRPPAPQPRRSKSTRSHERPFNTMPHMKSDEPMPERPARNYSTIVPDRPPRRPTSEIEASSRTTPYEEISDSNNDEVVRKLQSGEVLSKMKDRPLPAPPRPPREKIRKSEEPFRGSDLPQQPSQDENDENPDDNDDKGGSAVRRPLETASSFTDSEYKVEEVDVSCQTDPLPDDFQLEELEITDDMRTITPTMYREASHASRSHVNERFSRPETPSIEQELQRIRDGRPSSRHSHNASRTPSRPTTPALVYVERKVVTPLLNNEDQVEASLTAHQVEIDYDEETGNVIITGLVSDHTDHPTDHTEERKEDDILKSIEDAIIRAASPKHETRKEEEPEIKVVHEHKVEQTVPHEPEPVEEPLMKAVRAPVRPVPIVQPPELEPEPQVETVLEQEVPQSAPQPVEQPAPVTPTIPQPQPTLQQLSASDQPLHLSNLSVDRLSVNELQASKISVSELDSSTINSREIQCQSGNLSMRSIEIPPGVIEEIVERVNRIQKEQQADRQSPISVPPPSFYQLSSEPTTATTTPTTEEPVAPPRRARTQTAQNATEDHAPSEQPPTILSLTGQLANACGAELSRHGSNLMNYLRSFRKDENRRDAHFVLFILIIIIAGLFMIGMDHSSDRTIHHHHWDFFNPPKNGEQK